LKLDLANLYQKTGLKNLGTVFLMTDAQVADERFLVLINNLLASGEIPDLFGDDEVENIVTMVRNEVKGAGLQVQHFKIISWGQGNMYIEEGDIPLCSYQPA
jgi:dynein heavy chain